jgi:hypothetical protein
LVSSYDRVRSLPALILAYLTGVRRGKQRPDFLFMGGFLSDYTQMWLYLGLDLKAHDALPSMLRTGG